MKILYEVNVQGAYSNIAINRHLAAGSFGGADRAFITELVYGTITWKLTLDKVIAFYSKVKMGKLSPWILEILRMGAYQLLYMSGVPAHAACNESVKLAGRYGHKASAGFVNAVLRNISLNGAGGALAASRDDPAGWLSEMYSYPRWLAEKYIKLFGPDFAERLLDAGNRTPEPTVRANTLKISPAGLIKRLAAEGVDAAPGKYVGEAVVIKSHVSPANLEAFRDGLFQVQDESSMLPAMALAPRPGETVLDACSAPGGKTVQIAQMMENRGTIIAGDIYGHRLRLVDETAARLGIGIIKSKLRDASEPCPGNGNLFDRVLLDAPCTGLGTIRRKPDIKWTTREEDAGKIAALQKKMLLAVSKCVKQGGVLVYSTCTTLPEENEEIIMQFLDGNDEFSGDDIAPFMPEELAKHAKGCMLQVYPNRDGIDGFFIARLKRREEKKGI